ncbi:hypothetical protein PM082_019941 [Marasmius tenuissimus]|nr:hypothetical protein PM082_019941 [Marasmius tenuissimus]
MPFGQRFDSTPMLHIRFSILLFLLTSLFPSASSNDSSRFALCLDKIQHSGSNTSWVNNLGQPVDNPDNATAIPYGACVKECGASPYIHSWTTFAPEFSAWLLPYLALLSQLPFGARDRWDNLLAAILTVGSPALAAYSVAITVLNGRWIVRLFGSYSYPNRRNAVRILNSLQQSPLRITPDRCLLASLVVLPENDNWWSELVASLDYAHTWSISAASFIAWVVVAYAFTIANSFTDDIASKTQYSGQGVGAIWLWLIPVVFSWLQISPKCDSAMVRKAFNRANKVAYTAGINDHDPDLASRSSPHGAIYLDRDRSRTLYADQHISVPIYNYSRLFTWTEAAREVAACFSNATSHAESFKPVDSEMRWVYSFELVDSEMRRVEGDTVRSENRRGTSEQVVRYCFSESQPLPPEIFEHASGVWTRLVIASLAALGLQWGTTGAAFLTVYLTPTTGLGCRSGAYLIYGLAATFVMIMLILSSILAHYASVYSPRDSPKPHLKSVKGRLLAGSSIFLRRSGKILGFSNAIWLVMVCVFQIIGFFDRCYCNSSVIGRGAGGAYMVVKLLNPDIKHVLAGWIGGVALGVGTVVLFAIFMNLMIQACTDD